MIVDSLWIHKHIGRFAEDSVMAQWEVLILVEENVEIHELDLDKSSCQKVPWGCSSEEGGGAGRLPKKLESLQCQSTSLTRDRKQASKQKKPQEILRVGENSHSVSQVWKKWKKRFNRDLAAYSSDQESSDQSHVPSNNHQSSADASWVVKIPSGTPPAHCSMSQDIEQRH